MQTGNLQGQVSWSLVRNTNSQALLQTYWVKRSGDSTELSGSMLSPGFQLALVHTQVWEALL